jgi:hypothetical protein
MPSATELARAMGIDKSGAARLIRKGMPTHSLSAAEAWRAVNAPPRAKRKTSTPAPTRCAATAKASTAQSKDSIDPSAKGQDSAETSLTRARQAEAGAFRELERQQKNGSIDDLRRLNATYVQSRSNRQRAEKDFIEYQRQSQILLYLDEAKDIASRPHETVRGILQTAAKSLTPRLVGMPARAIETTLADFFDILTNHLRTSLDP